MTIFVRTGLQDLRIFKIVVDNPVRIMQPPTPERSRREGAFRLRWLWLVSATLNDHKQICTDAINRVSTQQKTTFVERSRNG